MNRSFHFDRQRQGQGDNGQSPYGDFNRSQGSDQGFRGFQGRNRFRQSFPQHPYRQQFSPHSPQSHRGRNNQPFWGKREIPISDYFHPSMLEDPWADLLDKEVSKETQESQEEVQEAEAAEDPVEKD
ncbi:uncharacterized protein LOC132255681 [Phlebotomus argentipes]|uniref:uncharacterized protein LOC132255681 n=1 Tax=Phlebotomus argentipes TaxID=94469 RepID=UPI002892EF48|nr:uncharacterized protein LOC132255681 [Phlebotomus argentipes]